METEIRFQSTNDVEWTKRRLELSDDGFYEAEAVYPDDYKVPAVPYMNSHCAIEVTAAVVSVLYNVISKAVEYHKNKSRIIASVDIEARRWKGLRCISFVIKTKPRRQFTTWSMVHEHLYMFIYNPKFRTPGLSSMLNDLCRLTKDKPIIPSILRQEIWNQVKASEYLYGGILNHDNKYEYSSKRQNLRVTVSFIEGYMLRKTAQYTYTDICKKCMTSFVNGGDYMRTLMSCFNI